MNERAIFDAALEIADPAQRQAFLEKECADNADLKSRVEALLQSHDSAGSFLETPAVNPLPSATANASEPTLDFSQQAKPTDNTDDEAGEDVEVALKILQPSEKPGSLGRLGHYEVLQVLGQGSFGIVLKAFDEKLHRYVAIKVMNPQMAATSPARKRFLREARASAAIRHENIVQTYSVEEQPLPYLVMEYIDGQTLQQKLDGHGPLEVAEVLHLGRQIASGLAAAHIPGLIHRDIKPANILLEQGAEQKVKITDFGLARAADDASLTRTGVIAGTPMYMAPEQATGQPLDHRADLFSLGSVLYQMASGRPPFRASTTVAVLRRVAEDTPRPLQEILPEIPDWLVTIVNKLLAKNPDERFQSAKEVADLLGRCQLELQLSGQVTCVNVDDFPCNSKSESRSDDVRRGSPDPAETLDRRSPAFRDGDVVAATAKRDLRAGGSAGSGDPRTTADSHTTQAPPKSKRSVLKTVAIAMVISFLAIPWVAQLLKPVINAWLWPPIPMLAEPAVPGVPRGLRFDGKDDYVEVGPLDWAFPQFTIEAFVTSDASSDNGTIAYLTSKGDMKKLEWMSLYDGSPAQPGQRLSGAAIRGTNEYASAYGPFAGGVRQHRVLVFDGYYLHYYINGIWQGKRRSSAHTGMVWQMKLLRLGCDGSERRFFQGKIDQVRISKVARYSDNFAPVTSVGSDDSTLALYNFDEGQGVVLTDVSGNGRNGRIYGATWVPGSHAVPPSPGSHRYESGEWIDVLSLIDPQTDTLNVSGFTGKNVWRKEGEELVVAWDEKASKLLLPLDSTWSSFECELEFTRRSGQSGFNVNIPSARGECPVVVDHPLGKGGVALGTRKDGVILKEGTQIETGKRATMRIEVRRQQNTDQIAVSLNGTSIGNWSGDRNRISKESNEGFPVGRRLSLWITEGGNEFVVHRLRVRMLDGEFATTLRPVPGMPSNGLPAATGRHEWPADAPPLAIAPFDAAQARQHQVAWAKYLGIPVEFTDKHGTPFVLIPPGEFQMGYTPSELDALVRELKQAQAGEYDVFAASSSGPQHKVRINKPFYMSVHEVTVARYRKFVEEIRYITTAEQLGGDRKKWTDYLAAENPDQRPAIGVSWTDAEAYCAHRSKEDGVTCRLPSEAEWEYACRAGTTTLWSFGDNPADLSQYAVVSSTEFITVEPVGSRKPNPFGLQDLYGNAEEWCRDWHNQGFYSQSPGDDPVSLETPADANSGRVTRGGGFVAALWQTRSSIRRWDYPSTPVGPKGFRVVITDDLKVAVQEASWHGWPANTPAPAIAPFNAEQAEQHQEAWAKYLSVPVEYTNSLGMKFRLIPPGEFSMGSTQEEIAAALKDVGENKQWQACIKSEAPQHKVILTQPIYLGVNEVTQAEYESVMGSNPSGFAPLGMGKERVAGLQTTDHPVEMVSWNDAAEFCAKLSKQEELKPFYVRAGETITPLNGTGYRLPSEAEWEFACRAGTATKYWIGDKDEDLVWAGWFDGNSGGRTHAARELKANPFGLSDIHGNVWEWVQDGWDATFYGQSLEQPAINPNRQFSAGSQRVFRGGSWFYHASSCRSSDRYARVPTARFDSLGFRVSLPVDAIKNVISQNSRTDTPEYKRFVEWMKSRGGHVGPEFPPDGSLPHMVTLAIEEAFTPEDIDHFRDLPGVQNMLVLASPKMTTRDMIQLGKMMEGKPIGGGTGIVDKPVGLDWLKEPGGFINSTGFTFQNCNAKSDQLAPLKNFPKLGSLNLRFNKDITDDAIVHLQELKKLAHLALEGTGITEAGLARLSAALPNCEIVPKPTTGLTTTPEYKRFVEWIKSRGGSVSPEFPPDGSLPHMVGLNEDPAAFKPIVDGDLERFLDLPGVQNGIGFRFQSLTTQGMIRLGQIMKDKPVNQVFLVDMSVGLDWLREPGGFAKIRGATLQNIDAKDEQLIHLKNLPELTGLNLRFNKGITDKAIVHFQELKTLRNLALDGTSITEAGFIRLRAALPDCEIVPLPAAKGTATPE